MDRRYANAVLKEPKELRDSETTLSLFDMITEPFQELSVQIYQASHYLIEGSNASFIILARDFR